MHNLTALIVVELDIEHIELRPLDEIDACIERAHQRIDALRQLTKQGEDHAHPREH